MAKKASVISFKDAYNKVSKKEEKKNNKKVNSSQKKSKSPSGSSDKKGNISNSTKLTKDEYIKRIMNNNEEKTAVKNTTKSTKTETKSVDSHRKKDNKNIRKQEPNKSKKELKQINKKEKVEKQEVKKEKKKKKFEVKARFVIIIILFILLIISGVALYFLWTSPNFNLTNVEIKPIKKYTIDEIFEKAEITYGSNIFRYDKKKSENNIKILPYVDKVNISVKLPSTLVIDIKERTKEYICLNSDTNEYLYISLDGYVLEKVSKDSLTLDDIIVSGIVFDDEVKLGIKLNDVELSKLIGLQTIKEGFTKENLNKKITSANFKNSLTYIILDDKIEVILPNTDKLIYNIRFLKKIFEEIDDVPGTIDMTRPSPSFIYKNI